MLEILYGFLYILRISGCIVFFKCIPVSYTHLDVYKRQVYAYKSGQYYDVSHGYEYYFDVNETHNMLNWVNEEGYTLSLIHI